MMMNYFGKILDGTDPNTRIDKTSWEPYLQTPITPTPCGGAPIGTFNGMQSPIMCYGTYYYPMQYPIYNYNTPTYQSDPMPSVSPVKPVFGGDVVIGIPLIMPTVESRQKDEMKTKFTDIKPGTFIKLYAGMTPYTDNETDNTLYSDKRVITKYGVRIKYKPSKDDKIIDLAFVEACMPDVMYVRIIHKSDTTLYLISSFVTIDQITNGQVGYSIVHVK